MISTYSTMQQDPDYDWAGEKHSERYPHAANKASYKEDITRGTDHRHADNRSSAGSASSLRDSSGMMLDEDTSHTSHWIDRDKLEEIETREMVAAGIPIDAHSPTERREDHDPRRNFSVQSVPYYDARDEVNDRNGSSPPPPSSASRTFRQKTRIPVSRNSPIPVPSAVVERESPLLQQFRKTSNAISTATRSDDGDETTAPQSPVPDSHRKSRPLSAHFAPDHASAPLGHNKRNSINGSPAQRSVSTPLKLAEAINPHSRVVKRTPGPIDRPEGEAPWLATMYKPDPHLPPDEQMLPTHAKRLAEEQARLQAQQEEADHRDRERERHQQQRQASLTAPDRSRTSLSHSRKNSAISAKDAALFPSISRQQQDGAQSLWPTAYIAEPSPTSLPGDKQRQSSVNSNGSQRGGYRITPVTSLSEQGGRQGLLQQSHHEPGYQGHGQYQAPYQSQYQNQWQGPGQHGGLAIDVPARKVLRKASSQSLRRNKSELEEKVESPLGGLPEVGITTTITGNDGEEKATSKSRKQKPKEEKEKQSGGGVGDAEDGKKCGCCIVM